MTQKHKNLSGNYTYRCQVCDLLFLPEEIPARYIKSQRTCVRCLVNAKQITGELQVPRCYGKKYDGLEEACIRLCTLREACIVEAVDHSSTKWSLDRQYLTPKHQQGLGRKLLFMHHAVRILRAAGRPMHSDDIAPIIAYNNGGEEKYKKSRKQWNHAVFKSCEKCDAIVCLGEKFFVWVGIWDLRDGGVLRKGVRHPEEKLLSIEEIFQDF